MLLINTGLDLLTSNKRCTLFYFIFTAQPCTNTASETQHATSRSTSKFKNINTGLFTFSVPSTGSFPHVVGGGGGVQRTEYSFN